MKKALALLLALVVLLTLCACGSDDSSQAEVELPKNGKKGPSQDLILQDLESALFQLPNAEVTEVTTVKSLTEDSHYEITLQVSAATTYADWQIECDMSYTKYDQGWILNDIDWNSKNYVISRIPDVAALSDIANNADVSGYYNDTLPVENGVIVASNVNDTGALKFTWTKIKEYLHAQCIGTYTTYWAYDAYTDNWVFEPSDDGFGFIRNEVVTPNNVDFSGTWDGIEISDFSWDGFRVKCGNIDAYFHKISGPPYNSESSYGWYTDGENRYFQIQCGPEGSSLAIYTFGHVTSQLAYASVKQELPPL